MRTLNRVTLLGNCTRDAELKATTNGQSVCTLGLATNRVWKDSTGNQQTLTEFHNLVTWGHLAEFSSQHVKKGKPLYVEGYLKTRAWDDPESGKKLYRTEIVVENLILLSPKEASDAALAPVEDTPF
jgi:single-strand DNA-binding protein